MFLRECKYIEKKVARHILDNLSGFPGFLREQFRKSLIKNSFFFNTSFITFQVFSIKAFQHLFVILPKKEALKYYKSN